MQRNSRMTILRYVLPSGMAAILVGVYFALSGAPNRVHFLSVPCFLLAFLVPSLIAPTPTAFRRRWPILVATILVAEIIWDGTAHLVILKAEPFLILRNAPWFYIFGLLLFMLTSFVSAVVIKSLAQASQ
jgi:hypothetical protein